MARRVDRVEMARLRVQGATVSELAKRFECSPRTIYRNIGGRRRSRRSDAGRIQKDLSEAVWQYIFKMSWHQNKVAAEIIEELEGAGVLAPGQILPGWLNRQLRDRFGLSRRRAQSNAPLITVRRERMRANIEHQFDGTPAAQWYIDASGDVCYEPDDPLKKDRQVKGKTRVHIFCLLDAYSRSVYLRAYDGETWENIHDFLGRGWARKGSPEVDPFCGLPKILYSDNTSGLANPAAQKALGAVGVKPVTHPPGQAWKKGKVERMLGLYQQRKEPLTRDVRFKTFTDFNIFLERVSRWYNNRVHGTTGEAPGARWSGFFERYPERLRLPPAFEQWQRLALRCEDVRIKRENLAISFGSGRARETVELLGIERFRRFVGMKVRVFYRPHSSDAILIQTPDVPGTPSMEVQVDRLRPAARLPSRALAGLQTVGEALRAEAREVDLSHLNLLAHLEKVTAEYPTPAGRPLELGSAGAFGPRMLDPWDALERIQKSGAMTPPTKDDTRLLAKLFDGAEEIAERRLDEFYAAYAKGGGWEHVYGEVPTEKAAAKISADAG